MNTVTTYTQTQKQDLQFGYTEEERVFNILKLKYPDIKKTGKYCPVDFISEETGYVFELKSRNCKKDDYTTTVLPYSKLQYADNLDPEYQLILLFSFTDGLYQVVYNKDLIYEVRKFCRNKRSDYNDKPKDYCFIPVIQLIRYIN